MESRLKCNNCHQPLEAEDLVCKNCGTLAPGVVELSSTDSNAKSGKSGCYWIGLILMISGFACGFLSLASGGYLFFREYFPQQEKNQPTQSAVLITSSPAIIRSTPTQPVESQKTDQSTPQKPPELTQQESDVNNPTRFFDDFSNVNSGWLDQVENTHRMGYFQTGNYSISILQPDLLVLATPPFAFDEPGGNIRIKVKAKGTGNGSYGVLCRFVDVDNFYRIGFSNDSYTISKCVNNKENDLIDPPWKKIIEYKPSSDGFLDIIVTCSNDQIQLVINEVLHEVIMDSELPQVDVALYASSEEGKNSDGIYEQAFFDDFSMELVEP